MSFMNDPQIRSYHFVFVQEYWRILENIDEDVMVEYGADLHTMDHGSGFPTLSSKNLSKEDEVYAKVRHDFQSNTVVSIRCFSFLFCSFSYSGVCSEWSNIPPLPSKHASIPVNILKEFDESVSPTHRM